jgi:hypothetical protein
LGWFFVIGFVAVAGREFVEEEAGAFGDVSFVAGGVGDSAGEGGDEIGPEAGAGEEFGRAGEGARGKLNLRRVLMFFFLTTLLTLGKRGEDDKEEGLAQSDGFAKMGAWDL